MPISTRIPIRRLSQPEFGGLAFEVMRQVFAIHNEIGRLLNERIYKCELARRIPSVQLEEPIEVTFGSFRKRYFLDVLIAEGGLFEFKSAEKLSERHRAQLLHYLLLCELAHGKLINVRPEQVEHEFVNTQWRFEHRLQFTIDADEWSETIPCATAMRDYLTAFLHDLGAGLEISLYEESVIHHFGGPEKIEADVPVRIGGQIVGEQRMRLIGSGVAFKITGLDGSLDEFESHARRLLSHADLQAIAWVNINMKHVTFKTLTK